MAFGAACLLSASAHVASAQQPDLVLNMTGSPDPVPAGGVVAYSITVLNDGPTSTATGVTVTVPVPAGASYSGFSGAGVACGGMTVGAAGPGTITCTLPNLTYLVTAALTVSLKTSVAGPFPVTATAAENEVDLDLSNNSITVTTTVVSGADVALTLSGAASAASGSSMAYNLSLLNNGPDAASNLTVQFPVPTGFVLTGGLPGGCALAAGTITCTVAGPIANGASLPIGPFTGQVSAASGSTITASASEAVSGSAPGGTAQDPNAANGTSVFNTTVTAGSDLALASPITRSTSAPYFVGSGFNFVITPSYTGDVPNGLTVTDVVPASYTIGALAASQNGWACGFVGQTVTCTKASGGVAGANQALGVITIPVTINATGVVTNTATITAISPSDPNAANNSASDGGANLQNPTADLSISISGPSPALVVTGIPFTETSNVSNGGPSLFYGTITMTVSFPAGVTLNSFTPNGWACLPAAPQTGPVSIVCTRVYPAVGALASGTTTPSVTWNLTTTAAGTITTTGGITTTGANVSDPNAANNNINFGVSSSVPVASADITVNNARDSVSIAAGNVLTDTIEVVNLGPQTSTSISITDNFTTLINSATGPTGAGFIGFVTSLGTASAVNCSSAPSGANSVQLSCTIPSLPVCTAGSTCPTIIVQVRPGGDGGLLSNTVSIISSATADPNLANNSATDNYTVVPRADVTVAISGVPNPVAAGQPLTYVVTATDNGPSLAANVTVVDTLPLNVIFVSAAPSAGSCGTTPAAGALTTGANQFVTCNLGSISNAAQKTVTIIVKPTNVTRGTSITNSVGVTTTTIEPTPPGQTNNQASVSDNVSNPSLDLTISNIDAPDPVTVGSTMTYTIKVQNIGPSDAENVVINDLLQATNLSYQSFTISSGTCPTVPAVSSFGGTVTCNVPRLTAGSSVTLVVTMLGTLKGVSSNTANVASDETAPGWENAANNTAVQNTTVRTRTDIQIVSKVASAPTGFRRPFTWTIVVSNPAGVGLAEADTVKVTDNLPAGMELTATPTAVIAIGTSTINACTGSAGSTSFICAFGTLSSGGEADITVPVRMITYPGLTVNNSATVTTSSQDINAANNTGTGTASILSSSIAGLVYRDFNANGTQDGGDTGISGVTMTITGTAFDASAYTTTTTTNGSGVFNFTGVPEGTYTISRGAAATPLLLLAPSVVGDHGGTASVVGSTPQVAGIALAQADAAAGYQFSLIPQARIGLAKAIVGTPTVSVVDGSYTIPVQILVKNYSLEQLDGIVINDPLSGAAPSFGTYVAGGAAAVLAIGNYTINAAPSIVSGSCGTATPNAAFDGSAVVKVADMTSLASAASCTLGFTIRWQPTVPLPGGGYANQASGSGTGHLSLQTPSDLSQSGANPDPDADGDPTNNNVPTPIVPALVADVTTSLAFPASVNAGQHVSGTVLFKNTGPYTGAGITYTLTLASNLAGVTFGNLPGGATAAYTLATGVVVLTGMPASLTSGQIASGDGTTGITVGYTQNATASSAIHSAIGTTTSQGTNTNPDVANFTVGGILIADVTTSMTFPASIDAGQTVVGHVVFKNTGPSVASGLTYTLTLSANLTGVSFANLPAGATAAYTAGTGVVTLGSMPATATLNQILSADGVNGIQVTYTQNATASSTVASTIATTTNEGANANPNSANATIGGQLVADVTTVLTFPVLANAGDPISGTIVYKNNGPSIASGVTYTLTATANLTGVSFGNLPGGATATYVPGTGVVTLTGMPATLNAAQIASGNGTTGITMNYTQFNTGVSVINSGIATTTNQGANVALDAAVASPGGGLVADMTTILAFPALVNAGQPVSGTVLWRNNGPSIGSTVAYTLTLTTGLAGVSFANLPAGVTAAYVSGTGVVTLTGMPATLAIGQVVSGDGVAGITVNYTQPGTATSTVTGNITTSTSEGANLAPNLATFTLGGTLIADVTTTLSFPALVSPGVTTDGLVVYRNAGPSIASGMTYTLTLATGLGAVSFTNMPGGASGAYNAGTGVVTFTAMPATLGIGAIASADGINGIGVHYPQPPATTAVASTIATTTNEGANALPDAATATVLGFQFTDLKVTKTNGVTSVTAGQTTVYTVRVSNNGGADVPPGATVYDSPSGLLLQSVACSTVANNRCTSAPTIAQITSGLPLPALPLGGFFEFLVTAQVTNQSGFISNSATATLPTGFQDSDSTNNTATDTDPVGTAALIGIAKAATPVQALANGHFSTTFTMKVVNYGSEALTGVRVTDPLATAAGGTFGIFAAGSPAAGQYTVQALAATGLAANGTFNGSSDPLAATGSLAVGASATVTFTLEFVPAASVSTFTNQATATGTGATTGNVTTDLSTSGSDPDPTGHNNPNGSNVPTTVGVPRIGLAKTAGPLVNNGNGTFDVTFSMVIANAGGVALSQVQVTDTLGAFGTPSASAQPNPGEYVITAGPTISNQVNGAALIAASAGAFTGAGNGTGLLSAASSLAAASGTGAASQASLSFTIRFFPRYAGQCLNSAVVSASTAGGGTVQAQSANGTVPDPTKASPTMVVCRGQNIGAALLATTPVQNGARRFLVPYRALVRNMDSVSTATNVQLSDDLKSTFPTAQSIIIVAPGSAASLAASAAPGSGLAGSTPGASRSAALNAAVSQFAVTTCSGTVLNLSPAPFDGITQKLMLAGNQSLLPREQCIFNFTVQVDFGTNPIPTVAQNMQTIATTALTPGGLVIATDSSANGPDPDPDANGNPRNNTIVTPVIFTVTPALVVTKTTPLTNVSTGQLVPYTITVSNPAGSEADSIDVRDLMPAGFSYRSGTASLDGVRRDPAISARTLDFTGVTVAPQASRVIRLMLVVGAGAQPGLYTNMAQAYAGVAVSGVASATVRVIPDATFDCSDIIGKVFDDKNGNGVQDEGERGLPGVRLISARGWIVTADAQGKFHVACAAIPDADRGSNFVMKLDERTLPTGYVLTTENPRSVRVTAGKMVELNFGATMRKEVRLDLTSGAFETGTTNLKAEWLPKLDGVHDAVGAGPFVLRIVLTAPRADDAMARERLDAVIALIRQRWREKPWSKSMQIERSLRYTDKPEGGR